MNRLVESFFHALGIVSLLASIGMLTCVILTVAAMALKVNFGPTIAGIVFFLAVWAGCYQGGRRGR